MFRGLSDSTVKMQYRLLEARGVLPWNGIPEIMFSIIIDLGPSPDFPEPGFQVLSQLFESRVSFYSSADVYKLPPHQVTAKTVENVVREELKKALSVLKKKFPGEKLDMRFARQKTARVEITNLH